MTTTDADPDAFPLALAIDSSPSPFGHRLRLRPLPLSSAFGHRVRPSPSATGARLQIQNAKFGDQMYYKLQLRQIMVGVIIIPRKYIMEKVDERAFKTFVILISASICILFIGCVCIFILTNGASKEMKLRVELIRQLNVRRKAEASSNYKSQFLANMSHELRTPMAAVIGLLDILIYDHCLTNEQYATITQIRQCSTALLRLLNNILDRFGQIFHSHEERHHMYWLVLMQVESGKLVLEETEFDLTRELEDLIDMFSVQCINHNAETIGKMSQYTTPSLAFYI